MADAHLFLFRLMASLIAHLLSVKRLHFSVVDGLIVYAGG